jgi:uncharacterized membrane protein YdbT with pleckstrin-like domain
MATETSERTLWQGTPSALAALPPYIALAGAAIAATFGLLMLRGAALARATVGARDPGRVFLWAVAALWIGCALVALAIFLRSRSTRYQVTSERLRITTGLLSTTTDDLELWRVRDSRVVRPALMRLLGLGHVVLISTDRSTPEVQLRAVRDPDALQTAIRGVMQGLSRRQGVREIDVT